MTANVLSLRQAFVARTTDRPADSNVQKPCATRVLARDSFLRLPHPLGCIVRCDSGVVWLTFDGDPRDVILRSGQMHRCDRNALLTLQGLEDARLRLE